MTRRRRGKKGSFGAHLEEVVQHFSTNARQARSEGADGDAARMRESRDIHTLLFERAWQLDQAEVARRSH